MTVVLSRPPKQSTERVAEPMFESVHQALLFAYTFTACQHAQTAVAERQIQAMGRERYESIRHVSRGLRGLDGAAQAGMVKRHVLLLPIAQRSMINARYSILDAKARIVAMRTLVLALRKSTQPVEMQFVAAIVQQFFGASVDVNDLAGQLGIARNTAYRRCWKVRGDMVTLDDVAHEQLDAAFKLAGIVAQA